MRIIDHGENDPIPYTPDPELTRWARYGVAQLQAQHQAEREADEPGEHHD